MVRIESDNGRSLLSVRNKWRASQDITGDDFYITHLTPNKDFIISINDGGVQKDFFKIDSSTPSLLLDGGAYAMDVSTPLFYIKGTGSAAIIGVAMRFDVDNTGGGTAYVSYGLPSTSGTAGGSCHRLYWS